MSDILPTFDALGLAAPILKAVQRIGYETPSAIQAECIPSLLQGNDMVGQAQTGTGKTGAFALPLLSRIDFQGKKPQILVLAPTRELAIQVAEAFQQYTQFMKGVNVLPIYGGQSYEIQLRQLKRGVQIVVGTPGRVMDHMNRGTLKLEDLEALVLDEADEMLRMGFIDDVEWILGHTPETRQIALFSATMPSVIRKVATRYLNNPDEIKVKAKTETANTIRQRYWQVNRMHKLDALTRVLESEPFDAVLIFVRTKTQTVELAEKLQARGYAAESLNGDITQKLRERTVDRLKKGGLDILIATDVVARGLDVPRISLVVNYDIPHDVESYVHRIGRTGRAGKKGDAILFVANKEKRLLFAIERATKQKIEAMHMPSTEVINEQRTARFKQQISDTISVEDLDFFTSLISDYQEEHDTDPQLIAAALARMAQGDQPLLLSEPSRKNQKYQADFESERDNFRDDERAPRKSRKRDESRRGKVPELGAKPLKDHPDVEMHRYRIDVGYEHDVKPGNIVGAIANEAGIESEYIGHIEIFDNFSCVDLPDGMPPEIFKSLKNAWVCSRKLNIALLTDKNCTSASQAKPSSAETDRPRKGGKGRPRGAKGGRGKASGSDGSRPPKRRR